RQGLHTLNPSRYAAHLDHSSTQECHSPWESVAPPNQNGSFPRLCAWRSAMPFRSDKRLESRRRCYLVDASRWQGTPRRRPWCAWMRQRPFPPAHGGGNLCGKTSRRSRTATPGSQRKYAQSVWANRTLALLGDMYVDWCPGVSPHRSRVPLQHLGLLDGQRRGRSCRFQRTAAKGFSMRSPAIFWPGFKSSERRRVAPLLTAAATMSASQKPIRDSSSIRNATESSAGVVSMHQIE